jgi:ketosteroid isomerase-like protein
MATPSASARALFERQMSCICSDDRGAQLLLYAEDCVYEFPFATDRPRRIVGRSEIRRVMTPLWEEARGKGVRVTGYEGTLHEASDPDLLIAEFTLSIEIGSARATIPFVQFIRVRGEQIVAVREYFSPQERSEALNG